MDIEGLSQKLRSIQEALHSQETTLKDLHKTLSEHTGLHTFEKEELRRDYRTFLGDYEASYDIANQEYQQAIDGLSESYLSLCPFYQGPSLPKPTFLDSSTDIGDLYALFVIMGVAHMYGISP